MGVTTGKTVLMIEDDQDLIPLVERVLQNVGMTISMSSTVESGLRDAMTNPPDLILLDLNFVGEKHSGLDFLKVRREHAILSKIPVIVFSSSTNKGIVLKSIALGADDFLVKPLNAMLLLSKVKKLLRCEPDKEFLFADEEHIAALVSVSCEAHRISEFNLIVNGPLKAAPNVNISVRSSLLEMLRLSGLALKTGRLLNSRSSGFSFTIDFIGVNENQMTTIRREGNKWNR